MINSDEKLNQIIKINAENSADEQYADESVTVPPSGPDSAALLDSLSAFSVAETAKTTETNAAPKKEEINNETAKTSDAAPKSDIVDIAAKTEVKADGNSPRELKPLSNEQVVERTASLWKYNPVPKDQPEPAPEYIDKTMTFPAGKVIAARVRGKKHKHEGTNCDDWFEAAHYKNIIAAAVSDGAGSKKFSRIGARKSCKAAVGYIISEYERLFTENPQLWQALQPKLSLTEENSIEACKSLTAVVQQAAIKAREAVEAAYYSRKPDPEYKKPLGRELQLNDFAATLLLAVIIPINEASKEHLIITCQIGDGMIAVLNSEGSFDNSLKLMGVPDKGDFSGETDFLTSPQMKKIDALQHRTRISIAQADTVMLMSDGVADDYFPNETEMRRLYFDLFVNGILNRANESSSEIALTQEHLKLFKRIPDPLAYPWVNDQSVKIPIQYTSRICDVMELSLEELWNDFTVLKLARLEIESEAQPDKKEQRPGEKLKVWLDNYVERGSFDDRTLALITM